MEQYILLHVRGSRVAVPVAMVTAIEAPAAVAPVPFMPPYVEGLAALRGHVLMQVDLGARLLGGMAGDATGGQLLLLAQGDHAPLALRVDRVGIMARPAVVAEARPANCASVGLGAALEEGLVSGCFADENGIAFVIDPTRILPADDGEAAEDGDGLLGLPGHDEALAEEDAGAEAESEAEGAVERAIVLRVGDSLRALPILEAKEVIPLADLYRPPHAPDDLLGLAPVRDRLVLVLSLKSMLGLREDGLAPKAVVMRTISMRYALAVDEVIGIRAFKTRTEIEGRGDCFIGDDGAAISILSVDTLDDERLARALAPFLALAQTHDAQAAAVETRRLMTFTIGLERCAIELDRVRRVMPWRRPDEVPDDDTRDLDGVVNVLGEVMPVLDLRGCLGDGAVDRSRQAMAYVVADIDGAPWALSVDALGRILTVPVTKVEPLGSRGPLAAVVRQDGDPLWVISPERSLQVRKTAGGANAAVA